MGSPMSDRQRQQRAAMIVGGAAVGGLAIIGLAIALSSGGGDDTNAIDVQRSSTTSSSTTSSSSTSTTSTSTTTTLVTLPPTVPSTSPPTIITVPTLPPTSPPTTAAPTTAPPTTDPPITTTTTKPLTPADELALSLDTALNGGQPDAPPRVTVKPLGNNKTLDVTWALDSTLSPDEQGVQAREDALVLLQSIQASNPPSNDKMRLKATLPKPGNDRVILLVIDRSQFDAFDFSGFDPDTTDIFTLPFVAPQPPSDINETYVPDPYPPSTTTTTDETTTTTDETTTTT